MAPKEAVKKAPASKAAAAKPAAGKSSTAAAKKTDKKAAPAKKVTKGKKVYPALWSAKAKSHGIGQGVAVKRDLSRFVRWPRYIKIQRQRRVLYHRLKVPPAINQFTYAADKNLSKNVINLLKKYRPETPKAKSLRLKAAAAAGAKKDTKKPVFAKCGVNHVTALVENKKAKLVIIAHDVDPIELVIHLPTLCRKMDVPYVILKGKALLGQFVHKKTATCLVLTAVRPEDEGALATLVSAARDAFNNNMEHRRNWGGLKLGVKSLAVITKRQRLAAKEAARKAAKKDADKDSDETKKAAGAKAKAKQNQKAKAKAAASVSFQ